MKRGIIVLAGLLLLVVMATGCETGKLSTEELTKQVQASMEETYASKPESAGIVITNLTLVHQSGNDYRGVLEATNNGTPITLVVEVTYDGKTMVWQTKLQ